MKGNPSLRRESALERREEELKKWKSGEFKTPEDLSDEMKKKYVEVKIKICEHDIERLKEKSDYKPLKL